MNALLEFLDPPETRRRYSKSELEEDELCVSSSLDEGDFTCGALTRCNDDTQSKFSFDENDNRENEFDEIDTRNEIVSPRSPRKLTRTKSSLLKKLGRIDNSNPVKMTRTFTHTKKTLKKDPVIGDRVKKEITVMAIGSRSRAQVKVSAPSRVPFSISGMSNANLNQRSKKDNRFKVPESRTGGMFHRIQPRPVMMDTSKFPVPSIKDRPAQLQHRISDNYHPQVNKIDINPLEEDRRRTQGQKHGNKLKRQNRGKKKSMKNKIGFFGRQQSNTNNDARNMGKNGELTLDSRIDKGINKAPISAINTPNDVDDDVSTISGVGAKTYNKAEGDIQNEVNSDGTITNAKVFYTEYGNDPSRTMSVGQFDESLLPEEQSLNVLVEIEASTVSRMDARIRRREISLPVYQTDKRIFPGLNFIGNVKKCGNITKEYGIEDGKRVAALVGSGGNAKYISVDATQLVKVPDEVSAEMAAVVIDTYLPAFQTLLINKTSEARYSPTALNGQIVFVHGGITNIGQALIDTALKLGASKVYTSAITKHHAILRSRGAEVIDLDPTAWPSEVFGIVDLVIDPTASTPDKSTMGLLVSGGTYVTFGDNNLGQKILNSLSTYTNRSDINSNVYHGFQYWFQNLDRSKKDLACLFYLLKKQKIAPQVAGTLALDKIAKAHEYLDSDKRIQGSFVCTPQK